VYFSNADFVTRYVGSVNVQLADIDIKKLTWPKFCI
jgi:hypothetical protein